MNSINIEIGPMEPREASALGTIYFRAIHSGAAALYSVEQCRAWAQAAPNGSDWNRRLLSQRTLVARIGCSLVGFMTLDNDGYIDLAFVDPVSQRQGIGQKLYERIEAMAREDGLARLQAQASLLAKGLFERNGWNVIKEQQVTKLDVPLTNFVMQKRIKAL